MYVKLLSGWKARRHGLKTKTLVLRGSFQVSEKAPTIWLHRCWIMHRTKNSLGAAGKRLNSASPSTKERGSAERSFPRMAADIETAFGDAEYADHARTYRGFVTGTVVFVAHTLLILLLLYYFVA
jgi:hypothetical protein